MARTAGEVGRRMHQLRRLGAMVSLTAVMVAGGRAALAPRAEQKVLEGEARDSVMHAVADDEPARRVHAVRMFPGDRWSQGDAFGGLEAEIARAQAAGRGVALESVLEVIDADLHARRVPGRQAGVPPCKPRPQYD